MQITYLNIEDIKPYKNNPRKNKEAIDYVVNSIKEFGFKVPITIDENNVIITGHTRYEASKRLGLKQVPCIIVKDLNEEQIRAYRLADNKVAEMTTWDFQKLEEEISDIKNINLNMYGFDDTIESFNWDDIEELVEENYEQPEQKMCECPYCHHIDAKMRFKKV